MEFENTMRGLKLERRGPLDVICEASSEVVFMRATWYIYRKRIFA